MKHTLIESLHDAEQHAYLVTIGTDMGQFSGAVACREEDYNRELKYFGFELAEIKAEIEYARAIRKHWSARHKALQGYWFDMSQTRSYDEEAYWVKKLCTAIQVARDNVNQASEQIKHLRVLYYNKIKELDKVNNKIKHE